MKNILKLNYITLFSILFLALSCDDDNEHINVIDDSNFISLQEEMKVGINPDETVTETIYIYASQTTGADRVFNVNVVENQLTDGSYSAIPSTITIPAGENVGSFDITVQDVDINLGEPRLLVLELADTSGYLVGNDTISLEFFEVCTANEVMGAFVFDDYASEISWELYDESNTLIANGGGWSDGDTSAEISFCLEDGTYTFVLRDSYGDGLADPGSFTLTSGGVELLSFSGNFGTSTYSQFILPAN